MNRPSLKFASRAFQAEIRSPSVWLILAALSIVLTLAAPFNTDDSLTPVPRFLYWVALVHLTYVAGYMATMTLQPVVQGWPFPFRALVQGLAVATLVIPIVAATNLLVLGFVTNPETEQYDGMAFVAVLTAICVLVTAAMLIASPPDSAAQKEKELRSPALLTRLPFEKRGALISISAEDHHVSVQTTLGEHWLRMRLADAIAEAQPVDGLQVHRSHWVAVSAIVSVRRNGKRATITMTHGPEIPVSRGRVADLKEADLLV